MRQSSGRVLARRGVTLAFPGTPVRVEDAARIRLGMSEFPPARMGIHRNDACAEEG